MVPVVRMAFCYLVGQTVLHLLLLAQLPHEVLTTVHEGQPLAFLLGPLWFFLPGLAFGLNRRRLVLSLWQVVEFIVPRCFGLKLEVFVLIGKAELIDQIWLDYFHIVVFFDIDLAVYRRRF